MICAVAALVVQAFDRAGDILNDACQFLVMAAMQGVAQAFELAVECLVHTFGGNGYPVHRQGQKFFQRLPIFFFAIMFVQTGKVLVLPV